MLCIANVVYVRADGEFVKGWAEGEIGNGGMMASEWDGWPYGAQSDGSGQSDPERYIPYMDYSSRYHGCGGSSEYWGDER